MSNSIANIAEFKEYKCVILERQEYINSTHRNGKKLSNIDVYNRLVRKAENDMWEMFNSLKPDLLQEIINSDFKNVVRRFNWIELEVFFNLIFRYNLDFSDQLISVEPLVSLIVKKLNSKNEITEKIPYIPLFESVVEILILYPQFDSTSILSQILRIKVPDRYENDYWSLFRKICHACTLKGGQKCRQLLVHLSQYDIPSIATIAKKALVNFDEKYN